MVREQQSGGPQSGRLVVSFLSPRIAEPTRSKDIARDVHCEAGDPQRPAHGLSPLFYWLGFILDMGFALDRKALRSVLNIVLRAARAMDL